MSDANSDITKLLIDLVGNFAHGDTRGGSFVGDVIATEADFLHPEPGFELPVRALYNDPQEFIYSMVRFMDFEGKSVGDTVAEIYLPNDANQLMLDFAKEMIAAIQHRDWEVFSNADNPNFFTQVGVGEYGTPQWGYLFSEDDVSFVSSVLSCGLEPEDFIVSNEESRKGFLPVGSQALTNYLLETKGDQRKVRLVAEVEEIEIDKFSVGSRINSYGSITSILGLRLFQNRGGYEECEPFVNDEGKNRINRTVREGFSIEPHGVELEYTKLTVKLTQPRKFHKDDGCDASAGLPSTYPAESNVLPFDNIAGERNAITRSTALCSSHACFNRLYLYHFGQEQDIGSVAKFYDTMEQNGPSKGIVPVILGNLSPEGYDPHIVYFDTQTNDFVESGTFAGEYAGPDALWRGVILGQKAVVDATSANEYLVPLLQEKGILAHTDELTYFENGTNFVTFAEEQNETYNAWGGHLYLMNALDGSNAKMEFEPKYEPIENPNRKAGSRSIFKF